MGLQGPFRAVIGTDGHAPGVRQSHLECANPDPRSGGSRGGEGTTIDRCITYAGSTLLIWQSSKALVQWYPVAADSLLTYVLNTVNILFLLTPFTLHHNTILLTQRKHYTATEEGKAT